MKKYFEYKDEKSDKFWEIEVIGFSHTVRYGKIGKEGMTKSIDFDSVELAHEDANKRIASKIRKGYLELTVKSNDDTQELIFPKFHAKYGQPRDSQKLDSEVIKKYQGRVPDILIQLWEQDGIGGYGDGYFWWTINPDDYTHYFTDWESLINSDYEFYNIIPFMRTAFGDIIYISHYKSDDINEEVWINIFDINSHVDTQLLTDSFEDFFETNLLKETSYDIPHLFLARQIEIFGYDKMPPPDKMHCYGFSKSLRNSGEDDIHNIELVLIHEYLAKQTLIIQTTFDSIKKLLEERNEVTKDLNFNKIKDENLRLAIVEVLISKEILNIDGDSIYEELFGRERSEGERYDPCEPIKEYLLSAIVKDEYLKDITEIDWDVPSDLKEYIWPLWDGECEYFHIENFEGIGLLPNLESLKGISVKISDLSALEVCAKLKYLSNENYEPIIDLSPLLSLQDLKHVEIYVEESDKNRECAIKLRGKNIDLEIGEWFTE